MCDAENLNALKVTDLVPKIQQKDHEDVKNVAQKIKRSLETISNIS